MQIDTYLTEAITSSSRENVPKVDFTANESSLDVTMIIDTKDVPSPGIEDFNDLDAVLNFESKEYSQLASVLNKNVTNKKLKEGEVDKKEEEEKIKTENIDAPEQSSKD